MRTEARTIWDTRIQCVCSVIAAREEASVEFWMCGNFGQASLDPPLIVINPNRLYPIEPMIRRTGRFSLNVMPASRRKDVLRLMRLRRREPDKAAVLGWRVDGAAGVPVLPFASRTLVCELQQALPTGDHTLMVARVLDVIDHSAAGEPPLLYPSVAGEPDWTEPLRRSARGLLRRLGILDRVRSIRSRMRPPVPADLPGTTYREGGQTEAEVETTLSFGAWDRGRVLKPPPVPPNVRERIGVCVVGTHWGLEHCAVLKQVNPAVRLFICGRDPDRTRAVAGRTRAEDFFIGLDRALRDSRVDAVVLALPHHLHRDAAVAALAAGKHVFVEKPIATTLEDADAMIRAAAEAGRILMAGEDMHFRPSVRLAAERIAAGDLGEPLACLVRCGAVRRPEGWVADREKLGGGVFIDIGIHYVRAIRLLMGEPDTVIARKPMQVNTKMTGEDSLNVLYESSAGWQASVFATWSGVPGPGPDIVIVGEKGTIHMWPRARHITCFPVAPTPATRLVGCVRPYWLQQRLMTPALQRRRLRIPGPERTGYPLEMREFLAAIVEQRAPSTTATDARRDLEIVLRTYDSLETGTVVHIPGA